MISSRKRDRKRVETSRPWQAHGVAGKIRDHKAPWEVSTMNHRVSASSRSIRHPPLPAAVLAAMMFCIPARVLLGQDDAPGAPGVPGARAAEMKQIAESLTVSLGEGALKRPVALRAEPLLRFNDPTRNTSDASLWAWGETGRPLAVVALEVDPRSDTNAGGVSWSLEFISLTPESLKFQEEYGLSAIDTPKTKQFLGGGIHWAPVKPGVTFREIPGAPAPAQTPRIRLAQMKDLSTRFAATEHPGRTTILRLMPHPIDRYADPAKGQVDGTIFVFANGTNPEVMVLIEAQGPSADKASWRFAVARLTVAPFEVTFDRREVWTESYHSEQINTHRGCYYSMRLPGK